MNSEPKVRHQHSQCVSNVRCQRSHYSEDPRDRSDEPQLRWFVRIRQSALLRKERRQVAGGFGQGVGNSMGVLSLL